MCRDIYRVLLERARFRGSKYFTIFQWLKNPSNLRHGANSWGHSIVMVCVILWICHLTRPGIGDIAERLLSLLALARKTQRDEHYSNFDDHIVVFDPIITLHIIKTWPQHLAPTVAEGLVKVRASS